MKGKDDRYDFQSQENVFPPAFDEILKIQIAKYLFIQLNIKKKKKIL